ncbi:MAG: hypothetical protein J6S21_07220, partial [Victivallales bacterium]|nr:hypothetical protein [Victivallales bacterium]
MSKKLYVISNSHLDPIWLWRRRSGRSAWCNTMHSVIRMMKRHPELKFTCSSAAMYRWIEENEPALFREIAAMIECGRWEVIGGWEVQSDAIIASTESLIRQGLAGKEYFRRKFGIEIDTGYCVDSFGHSAGLPKIFNATGYSRYVFLRPMAKASDLPLLFRWQGEGNSEVTALRIMDTYNIENVDKAWYMDRIEQHVASPLEKQTLFFGVGDHGGGIYETHMQWLQEASEKHEIVFTTLKEYFDAVAQDEIPVYEGELGPMFPGCYSACHQVKSAIASAGQRLRIAELSGAGYQEMEPLQQEYLFNHFHDILPGTSVKEAYMKDIFPSIGGLTVEADNIIDRKLCRVAAAEDTTFMEQGGVMVWNPDCRGKNGIFSFAGFADPNETGRIFNAVCDKDGNEYPMQVLPPQTTFGPCTVPWGNLTVSLPLAAGEKKFLAWSYTDKAYPNVGFEAQKELAGKLSFLRFHDDAGTWGFNLTSFINWEQKAELVSTEERINGPVCSVYRLNYKICSSFIRADLVKYAGIDEVKIALYIDWHEPMSCLKMAVEAPWRDGVVVAGTPGGEIQRVRIAEMGTPYAYYGAEFKRFCRVMPERAMNDWYGSFSPDGNTVIYSSDLHSCDYGEWSLRISLLRPVMYADHHPFPRNTETGVMDLGVTELELWYSGKAPAVEEVPARAQTLLNGFEAFEVTCHEAGDACPELGFAMPELPASVTLEGAFRTAEGKIQVHLLNHGGDTAVALPG